MNKRGRGAVYGLCPKHHRLKKEEFSVVNDELFCPACQLWWKVSEMGAWQIVPYTPNE